jgi:hypothetical protein
VCDCRENDKLSADRAQIQRKLVEQAKEVATYEDRVRCLVLLMAYWIGCGIEECYRDATKGWCWR